MALERLEGYLTVTYALVGQGVEVCREDDGSVCIEVEYDDPSWADRHHKSQLYITISREDWSALVTAMGENLREENQ